MLICILITYSFGTNLALKSIRRRPFCIVGRSIALTSGHKVKNRRVHRAVSTHRDECNLGTLRVRRGRWAICGLVRWLPAWSSFPHRSYRKGVRCSRTTTRATRRQDFEAPCYGVGRCYCPSRACRSARREKRRKGVRMGGRGHVLGTGRRAARGSAAIGPAHKHRRDPLSPCLRAAPCSRNREVAAW